MITTLWQAGITVLNQVTNLYSFIWGTIPSSLASYLGLSTDTTYLAMIITPSILIAILGVVIARWVWKSII